MKKLVLIAFSLASVSAFAKDATLCNIYANLIDMSQERFDRAEAAVKNASFICGDEAKPEVCVEEIKKEYDDASREFEKAKAGYKTAGCEE